MTIYPPGVRTEWAADLDLDYFNPILAQARADHEERMAASQRRGALQNAVHEVALRRQNALAWCAIRRDPAARGYRVDAVSRASYDAARACTIRTYLRTKAWAAQMRRDYGVI